MGIENLNDPRVILGRKRRNVAQIRANGGYYITDCHPWEIKAGCTREDCPMRYVASVPEPKETDHFLPCNPTGDLADMLILFERTMPVLDIKNQ